MSPQLTELITGMARKLHQLLHVLFHSPAVGLWHGHYHVEDFAHEMPAGIERGGGRKVVNCFLRNVVTFVEHINGLFLRGRIIPPPSDRSDNTMSWLAITTSTDSSRARARKNGQR